MDEAGDRNLLFGILAVQLDYVRGWQFMEGANQWMLSKKTPLGCVLVAKGYLSDEDRKFIDTIVEKHVSRSGSPQKSLESLQASSVEISGLTDQTSEFRTRYSAAIVEHQEGDELTGSFAAAGGESIVGKRFSLLRELARGGLGEVYVARDLELDRDVALKKILNNRRHSQDIHDRFLAEAKITGGLEHPGIVPVYGLGSFPNGAPFYAMRLIRGQSLHEAIHSLHQIEGKSNDEAANDRTLRKLVRAVIDACYAIGYANSRGVIHRDIKPQNIMMGKYGETLVVDLGLAKVKGIDDAAYLVSEAPMDDARLSDSSPTEMGSILGTYAYMSPEQANGRIDLVDRRSDVFSLGATLYAVITGRPLYREDNRDETLVAARLCRFSPPRELNPRISKSLEAICLKALSKEPAQRYGNAVELAEDLDNWSAGAPVKAYPERLAQRTLRFARKHQTLVASAFVFLCVASVGLLLANWAVGRQRNIAMQERDRANDASKIAIEERNNAQEMRVQAELESERARQNSETSSAILEQFVKTIVGDKWANLPNLDDERLAMYELALKRFQDLLKTSPNNPGLLKNVCQLYTRSADIYRHRGNDDEADRCSEAAVQLAEQAIATTDGDIELLYLIADSSRSLTQNKLSRLGAVKALPFSEKSKQISLRRSQLDNRSSAKLSLALTLLQHSEICRDIGDAESALTDAKAASAILEKIPPSKSRPYVQPIYYLSSLTAQSLALANLGQLDEAANVGNEAIDMTTKRIADFPDIIDMKTVFVEACLAVANVERLRKQFDTASKHAENALKTTEEMRAISQSNVNYRLFLADGYRAISFIAIDRSDKTAALVAAERSQAALETVFVDQPLNASTIASQVLIRAALYAALDSEQHSERLAETKLLLDSDLRSLQSTNPTHPAIKQADALMAR